MPLRRATTYDTLYDWTGAEPYKPGAGPYFSLLPNNVRAQQEQDAREADARLHSGLGEEIAANQFRGFSAPGELTQQLNRDGGYGVSGGTGGYGYTPMGSSPAERFLYQHPEQAPSVIGGMNEMQALNVRQHLGDQGRIEEGRQFDSNQQRMRDVEAQNAYEFEKRGNTQAYQYERDQQQRNDELRFHASNDERARQSNQDFQYGLNNQKFGQDAYHQLLQQQIHERMKDVELSGKEKDRKAQLQEAISFVNDVPDLRPEERSALLTQIVHRLDPLMEREKRTQARQQTEMMEQHAAVYQQQAAHQAAIDQENASFRAKNAQQRVHTVTAPDGSVHSFIETAPGKMERLKDEGHYQQEIAKAAEDIQKSSLGEDGRPTVGYKDAVQMAIDRKAHLDSVLGKGQRTPAGPPTAFFPGAQPQEYPKGFAGYNGTAPITAAVRSTPADRPLDVTTGSRRAVKAEKPIDPAALAAKANAYAKDFFPEAIHAANNNKTHPESGLAKATMEAYMANRTPDDNPDGPVSDEENDRAWAQRRELTKAYEDAAKVRKSKNQSLSMPTELTKRLESLRQVNLRYMAQSHAQEQQSTQPQMSDQERARAILRQRGRQFE